VIPCNLVTSATEQLCLENLFRIANITHPFKAVIWLQPLLTPIQKLLDQNPFPSLFISFNLLWIVKIDPSEQYPLKIVHDQITEVKVQSFKMLRTIGTGIFQEFCKGKNNVHYSFCLDV
jgi:hypothetical protein